MYKFFAIITLVTAFVAFAVSHNSPSRDQAMAQRLGLKVCAVSDTINKAIQDSGLYILSRSKLSNINITPSQQLPGALVYHFTIQINGEGTKTIRPLFLTAGSDVSPHATFPVEAPVKGFTYGTCPTELIYTEEFKAVLDLAMDHIEAKFPDVTIQENLTKLGLNQCAIIFHGFKGIKDGIPNSTNYAQIRAYFIKGPK